MKRLFGLVSVLPLRLVFGVLMVTPIAPSVKAGDCASCDASTSITGAASTHASSDSSGVQRISVSRSKLPKNGTVNIGRWDEYRLVAVVKNHQIVDAYLAHMKTGKKIFGTTRFFSTKVFSKCFEVKKLIKLKFCVEIFVGI